MNNDQNNGSGTSHDASPENASSNQISLKATHLNDFINITTHNVQGLSTVKKQQQLNTFLLTNNIDIMGISETKLSTLNAKYLLKNNNNSEYLSWWDSEGVQMSSGVGIIIRKQLALHVRSCKSYKGRIIYSMLTYSSKENLN